MRASCGAIVLGYVCVGACAQTRDAGHEASAGIDGGGTSASAADGDATTSQGSSGGAHDDGLDEGGPILDVAAPGGGDGSGEGPCGGGDVEHSHIWISNTSDDPPTVVKIDTRTLAEKGRYLTRADGLGDPSRTSVALSGHAAVGNRSGGVTKYYAYDCPPGPTSTGGAGSELAWGTDACVAWSVDFEYETQRPIAWTPGTFDAQACRWTDEMLWSAGSNVGSPIEVLRLDGDSGAVVDQIVIPEIASGFYGAYGGAVDGDGNFWLTQLGIDGKDLVRVDASTLEVEIHPHEIEGYGIQVDNAGRPWICGYDGQLARFTPASATWAFADTGAPMFGCMPDETRMWVGGLASDIRAIDLEAMTVVATHALPMMDNPDIHGMSIDVDGKIWAVGIGTMAARVDPVSGVVDYVTGLDGPYTYSDMTGYALGNAGSPEG